MSQFLLSRVEIRQPFAKNILKFVLNINVAAATATTTACKSIHSKVKEIDLLQINRKNMQCVTLSGAEAYKMPIIGLGTWKAVQGEVYNAVLAALNVGYRHIDTAFNYNNEDQIGKAINKWLSEEKGAREHLFVTSKLPNYGNRAKDVEKFLKKSLEKLGLEYLDLYLIHMPFALELNDAGDGPQLGDDGEVIIDVSNDNSATWKVMEQQVKKGLVKSIGLSNFNAKQVQKIYDDAEIKPAVLQVELHANMQQTELIEACRRMKIAVTAYAPLGSPAAVSHFKSKYNYEMKTSENLLTHPVVESIARKYQKTTGQILLRHLVEKNIVVIPKSSNPKRIEDNFKIFDFNLDQEDMTKLNAIDKKDDGRMFNFRFFKGVENHPEYPFK